MDSTNFTTPVPEPTAPEPAINELDTSDITYDADTILNEILSVNEDGHSPSLITVSLERINTIVPGKALLDYSDEEKEFVDSINISDCSVDIFSLDGNLFNVVFTFDTKESAYLKDFNDILNRYRRITEEYAANQVTDKGVALTIIIAPESLKGKGLCSMSMPVMYVRCLNDNGENVSMYTQFYAEDVDFLSLEMTEEEEIALTADAMRLSSEGMGGEIF